MAISTTPQFAERIAKLPLAEQPGTLWDYGHSTDVLGRVIEVVSGTIAVSVREAAAARSPRDDRDRVLRRRSGEAAVASPSRCPTIALPARSPESGIRCVPRRWESGGAGMVGTIGDYARFAQMLLNGGTLGWQALSQARDHRPDDVGSYRAGDRNRARLFLFSGRSTAASALALPCAPRSRRIRRGRSANIAGTASAAPSSLSIRRTICSWSA